MEYPYAGFFLKWCFYEDSLRYKNYQNNRRVDDQVFMDIIDVPNITSKHNLLQPTYLYNKGEKVTFKSDNIKEIVTEIEYMISNGRLSFEIERIGGTGVIYTSPSTFVNREDILLLESFRFFERQICLSTSKSLWVPINLDINYKFEWQIEIAALNAPRLEVCLNEIFEKLKINVEPTPHELRKEYPIWQKGFKLFINPEIVKREYQEKPHPNFLLAKYLKEIE